MNKPLAPQSAFLFFFLTATFLFSPAARAHDKTSYSVNIKQVNYLSFPNPTDIQLYESLAYILSGGTIIKMDISDPANPKDIVSYNTIGDVSQMAVFGVYCYAAVGTRIRVFDISSNPPVDKTFIEANGIVSRIMVSNGYLVFIRKDLGAFFYDLKYPNSPILKGSQIVPCDANSLWLKDRKAYVTCESAHLSIIDFNDAVKLPVIGTYMFGLNFYDVYVNENFVYLPQGSSGVQVLNVNAPSTPRWVTNIFSRKFSKQVVVSNYYAWVNDDNTVQAFYIKDASSYLYAGSFDNKEYSFNRIAVISGKYIYACSSDNYLKILQIYYNY